MSFRLFPRGITGVKICGITNEKDAESAVASGADAIGINFYRGSKRFVELADAVRWLPGVSVPRVAVVVNPDPNDAAAILDSGCLDCLQFHGDETPDACVRLAGRMPWIRAVRVSAQGVLDLALEYATSSLLLDACSPSGYGGTGERVNAALAARFVRDHPSREVVLAGGLTPTNVKSACEMVAPSGVDVAGGVESDGDPRFKDPEKMRAFVAAVRTAKPIAG